MILQNLFFSVVLIFYALTPVGGKHKLARFTKGAHVEDKTKFPPMRSLRKAGGRTLATTPDNINEEQFRNYYEIFNYQDHFEGNSSYFRFYYFFYNQRALSKVYSQNPIIENRMYRGFGKKNSSDKAIVYYIHNKDDLNGNKTHFLNLFDYTVFNRDVSKIKVGQPTRVQFQGILLDVDNIAGLKLTEELIFSELFLNYFYFFLDLV